MVRSVGERDFSAQETAHQLVSLPLVACSFSFVTLSLDGGRPLRKDEHSGEQVHLNTWHLHDTRGYNGNRLAYLWIFFCARHTLRMRIPSNNITMKMRDIIGMSLSRHRLHTLLHGISL